MMTYVERVRQERTDSGRGENFLGGKNDEEDIILEFFLLLYRAF
jgi:hypothetical protein